MDRSSQEVGTETGTIGNGVAPNASGTDAQAARTSPWQYQEWLQRAIETELVPRLMLVNRISSAAFPDQAGPQVRPPDADDVRRLTELLLVDEPSACESFVESFRARQVSLDQVLLELLAPAARRLGELWESDDCDFTQVTIGLCRIQAMLFEFNQVPPALATDASGIARKALLCAMPGSEHTLGALMLSEFFRRADWDVSNDACRSDAELASIARRNWFDLIGLSVSTDAQLEKLSSLIILLRGASRNAGVVVMVGGSAISANPDRAAAVGADLIAKDAREAVDLATGWLKTNTAKA